MRMTDGTRANRYHETGPGYPGPNVVAIIAELVSALRNPWIWRAAFIAGLVYLSASFWPEPVERADIDFVSLQDSVIRGGVESVTISGTEVRGRFYRGMAAHEGEIIGSHQPIPDGVTVDDLYDANAFESTIPDHAKDGFIDLLERQGVEVQIH